MKIWVLTASYNDYDQHGEYFLKAFKDKPQIGENIPYVDDYGYPTGIIVDEHLFNGGGGRKEYEYQWYHLREVVI